MIELQTRMKPKHEYAELCGLAELYYLSNIDNLKEEKLLQFTFIELILLGAVTIKQVLRAPMPGVPKKFKYTLVQKNWDFKGPILDRHKLYLDVWEKDERIQLRFLNYEVYKIVGRYNRFRKKHFEKPLKEAGLITTKGGIQNLLSPKYGLTYKGKEFMDIVGDWLKNVDVNLLNWINTAPSYARGILHDFSALMLLSESYSPMDLVKLGVLTEARMAEVTDNAGNTDPSSNPGFELYLPKAVNWTGDLVGKLALIDDLYFERGALDILED